jgi:hypothetical protein
MPASRGNRGGQGPGGLEAIQSCVSWDRSAGFGAGVDPATPGTKDGVGVRGGLGVGWRSAICWPQSPSNPGAGVGAGMASGAMRSRAWVVAGPPRDSGGPG